MPGHGLAVLAIALAGYAFLPAESTGPGKRTESDSYTAPAEAARCIAYNINKKMTNLSVRSQAGDTTGESVFLILTNKDASPTTFGVIRVDQSESGSHLTTWLSERSLAVAPGDVANRLVAGC